MAPSSVPAAVRALAAPALRADEVSRHAARMVVVDGGALRVVAFAALPALLRRGDLVVVNDAATLPASLFGATARGEPFELRLAGPVERRVWRGVLLGAGDHHTRTEDRPAPPRVAVGELVRIGGDHEARVVDVDGGRRIAIAVRAEDVDDLWAALYANGAPVQYAHRPDALPLHAVQTAYAARPWAAEMPSAGRPLTCDVLLGLRRAGIAVASLTHAAGLSSTGDAALDAALPWPERYAIPAATAAAIARTRAAGGRVIAIGTTVVRALESAAIATPAATTSALAATTSTPAATTSALAATTSTPAATTSALVATASTPAATTSALVATTSSAAPAPAAVRAGEGIATLRLDPAYVPRIVDGIVSGLHAPGESHFELLGAFAAREHLVAAIALAAAHGMSAHELGDTCLVIR